MTPYRKEKIIPKFFFKFAYQPAFQGVFSLIRDLQNFGITNLMPNSA
jgi:hypothetical protein